MFNIEIFKNRTQELQKCMQSSLRGKLSTEVERKIIDEFSEIFMSIPEKYSVALETGKALPALQRVENFPREERVFRALLELLERMELDFSQKFALDVKHDLEKEIEIGKIKFAFLDGIRRGLNSARILA